MGETRAGTEHARRVCFKLKACQRTALKHAGPRECLQMTSLFKNSSASYSTADFCSTLNSDTNELRSNYRKRSREDTDIL